ncbi:MAG: ribonuclease HII [Clostridia bacterium]|jgi:ribonuclease HII
MNIKELKTTVYSMDLLKAIEFVYSLEEADKYEKVRSSLEKEILRCRKMRRYEDSLISFGNIYIAGVDEVGRGPLAGPLVTGAVILGNDYMAYGINDSKKVSPKMREVLYDNIQKNAVAVSMQTVANDEIDRIGIANADRYAMCLSVNTLDVVPDHVLIDAMTLKDLDINHTAIIHGDALSISIAAASIVAKVTRDRMMDEYDKIYPEYGFIRNKGYGTQEHIDAIKKYGICPIHRKTFLKNFI